VIAALVPIKALSEVKERLASILDPQERKALALAMLTDVVTALLGAASIAYLAVVSPDPEALQYAEKLGAHPIPEPSHTRGINASLSYGVYFLSQKGATAVLVVPADLPTLAPSLVDEVIQALPQPKGMAIVPSAEGGTNALALRPPQAIPFRFGPKSFTAHRREAVARGIPTVVLRLETLAYDVDSPQDLLRLEGAQGAHHTLALIKSLNIPQRLKGGT